MALVACGGRSASDDAVGTPGDPSESSGGEARRWRLASSSRHHRASLRRDDPGVRPALLRVGPLREPHGVRRRASRGLPSAPRRGDHGLVHGRWHVRRRHHSRTPRGDRARHDRTSRGIGERLEPGRACRQHHRLARFPGLEKQPPRQIVLRRRRAGKRDAWCATASGPFDRLRRSATPNANEAAPARRPARTRHAPRSRPGARGPATSAAARRCDDGQDG